MHWHLHLTGRVQGVGFRPHVYRLARAFGLRGWVRNGEDGVRIAFTGEAELARAFADRLLAEPPRLSLITQHQLSRTAGPEVPYPDFRIVASASSGAADLLVAPDFALCADCQRDITEPGSRRCGYAFTTCTNCGPRYAIQRGLPYDRERTSMAGFAMCDDCRREYENPNDRRYFSQTNSCPDCGISLDLLDGFGARTRVQFLSRVTELIATGHIVAVKNTAGFLLCCDARNEAAVRELRRRKARPDKPLAILCADLTLARRYATIQTDEAEELTGPLAPIVLLPKRDKVDLAPGIASGLDRLGVMLPNSALLALLASGAEGPLIATSANVSGQPILAEGREEAVGRLADYVLTHDLPIVQAQDDSVVSFAPHSRRRIVHRRGRGLAPALLPPAATPTSEDVLACGGDLKSAVGLQAGPNYYLGPYLGNLADPATHRRLRQTVDRLLTVSSARPAVVLTDIHPGYFSRELGQVLAEENRANVRRIQHHEAHFAAILGEHRLVNSEDPVLGVIWDGTGLGHDGNIWGGEFLRYEAGTFERVTHLDYFPHLGGDKLAREPRYAALVVAGHLPAAREILEPKFSPSEFRNLLHLRPRQKLLSSSTGRLFDAVACLLGLGDVQSYEGMAATRLEQLARRGMHDGLTGYATENLLPGLLQDLAVTHPAIVAARFHLTLVDWARRVAEEQGVGQLAFSGGCFQNSLLVDLLSERLSDYRLYFHEQLPPNDENLAYGQLIHHRITATRECSVTKTTDHVLSHTG
jgi:hydrogenase maturation protein HypF